MSIWELIKLFLIFGLIFLFPGAVFLLVTGRFSGASLLAIFSFGFLLSLFILSLFALLGIFLILKMEALIFFALIIIILSFVTAIYCLWRRRRFKWQRYFDRFYQKLRPEDFSFLVVMLVVFVLVLYRGAFLEFGDVWVHIAYITKFFGAENLTAEYPFFPAPPDTNYGYCPLHPLFALLALLSGRSVLWVWYYLPALFTPLVLAVNYYFARLLTQSRFVALLSVLFLIYSLGLIGSPLFGFAIAPYPRNLVVLIIFPLLWLVALQTIKIFTRINLLLLVLGFSLAVIIHKLTAIHFAIAYIVFALVAAISRGGRASNWYLRLVMLFLYMLLLLGIYNLFNPAVPITNPVHLEFRQDEILRLGKTTLSLASPNIFLFQAGPITAHIPLTPLPLFAYFLLPALFLSPKRNTLGKIYLLANGILLPLTIFNPLIFPLMTKLMTVEGSVRLVQTVPYHIIFPYALYLIIQRILTELYQTLRSRRNRYYIDGTIALLFSVFLTLYVGINLTPRGKLIKNEEEILRLNPLFSMADYIKKHLRVEEEYLISDFYSSYVISALTNIAVAGIPQTMSAPNHSSILFRNQTIYRFFGDEPWSNRLLLVKMHKFTLALLNLREIEPFASKLQQEFAQLPQNFQLLKVTDSLFLYRIKLK